MLRWGGGQPYGLMVPDLQSALEVPSLETRAHGRASGGVEHAQSISRYGFLYLEAPEIWRGFYHALASEIITQLHAVLSPRYYADVEVRTVLEAVGIAATKTVYPDAAILETVVTTPASATAVAIPAAPIQRLAMLPEEHKLRTVQVRETATDTLVTAIEVLSPVNKRGDGLSLYRAKRKSLIQTEVHLIELDLLRGGERPGWEVKEPPLVCGIWSWCIASLAEICAAPRSGPWCCMSRCRCARSPCCHRMRMCLYHLARCWRRYTSGRPMPGALTTRCPCRLPRYVRRCSTGVLPMSHRPRNSPTSEIGRVGRTMLAASPAGPWPLAGRRCQSLR